MFRQRPRYWPTFRWANFFLSQILNNLSFFQVDFWSSWLGFRFLHSHKIQQPKNLPTPSWTLKVIWCQVKGTFVLQPDGTLSWKDCFLLGGIYGVFFFSLVFISLFSFFEGIVLLLSCSLIYIFLVHIFGIHLFLYHFIVLFLLILGKTTKTKLNPEVNINQVL